MDKSEKSFYVIIENKKRGKFYGAGPIQVAKKVASKKLKSGNKIEFYLDEAGGKKKRYGPYQATKDKKSGKVSVVKGRKVMKGGLLSSRDREILIRIFNNNCFYSKPSNQTSNQTPKPFIKQVSFNDIKIYFVAQSVLIFFKKNYEEQIYTHAIFVDPNRTYVWILKKNDDTVIVFISFADFFLNPEYLSESERNYIIENLNTNISSIRRDEANIIRPILSDIRSVVIEKKNEAIYLPDYSQPLKRKCVYPPDLTFGILDEQRSERIPENSSNFPEPESPYQRFLILTNTGISGMSVNEPIIYVRVPIIQQIQRGGTLTAEQIQAKINYLKTELEKFNRLKKNINNIINQRKVLQPARNIGYKPPLEVLKREEENNELSKNISKSIEKVKSEITKLQQQLLQQEQLQQQQLQQEQLQQQLLQQQLLQQQQLQQRENQIFKRSINSNNTEALQEFRKELQKQLHPAQLQQVQLQPQLHFDYCIFSSGYNQLKIMFFNNTVQAVQEFRFDNKNLYKININIFKNLLDIPELFGRLKRIKDISRIIFNKKIQDISFIQNIENKIAKLFLINNKISNPKINKNILASKFEPMQERIKKLKNQNGTLTLKQMNNIGKNIHRTFDDVLRESQAKT